MSLSRLPLPARAYGFAGLIPFFAGAAGAWIAAPGEAGWILRAQVAYGAVILSFLGALHWGVALGRSGTASEARRTMTWRRLGLAVTPALIAWLALLAPTDAALILLATAFAGLYLLDRHSTAAGEMPAFHLSLRLPLTIGAVLALGLSLFALKLAA